MLKENISTFDFFNHLISGFLLLFLIAGHIQPLAGPDGDGFFPWQLVMAFAFALVCGHLITELSYWCIQVLVIRRVLGSADRYALGLQSAPTLSKISGFYFCALPDTSLQAVAVAAKRCKQAIDCPGFVAHAYFTVRESGVSNQLDIFQNNYVFSRNLLLLLPIAVIEYGTLAAASVGWPAVIVAAVAIELLIFIRYLRFLREHFNEVAGIYSRVMRPKARS